MSNGGFYERVGEVVGPLAALAAFAASWVYCIFHYGYLLGVGLGWLPSIVVAILAWIIGRHGWLLALLGGLYAFAKLTGIAGPYK